MPLDFPAGTWAQTALRMLLGQPVAQRQNCNPLMSRVYRHFSTAFWIICLSMRRDRPSPKAEAERGGGKKGLKDRGRDGLQLADVQG